MLRTLILLAAGAVLGCTDGMSSVCSQAFDDKRGFVLPPFLPSCPGCRENDLRAAIDGSLDSAAVIIFNADGLSPAGGHYSLDVINGSRFRPGGRVGAYMTFPGTSSTAIGISFITYLDGDERDRIDCTSDVGRCEAVPGPIQGAGTLTYFGGRTALSFDQVNVRVTLTGTAAPAEVLINEVCAAQ